MAKLYVASSWRNPYQPYIVQLARKNGLEVYDFRNPIEGDHGFSWKQIVDKDPKQWTFNEYREILKHPIAEHGFQLDMNGLQADAIDTLNRKKRALWEHLCSLHDIPPGGD